MRLLQISTLVCLMTIASSAFAAGSFSVTGLGYRLEPIIGYETVYRDAPQPHTLTRTIYGARVVVGPTFLAAELEYTKGEDTENFSTAPEKIVNNDEKAKLGIRSSYHFNSYVFLTGRLGCQGTRGYY
jgi:hypothetical protein